MTPGRVQLRNVTVDRHGPEGRPDYEIGIDDEHVRTLTAEQADALYWALGVVLGKGPK
jgi:hypothetical protein